MTTSCLPSLCVFLLRLMPLLMLAFATTSAVAQADPPRRAAALSHMEGSVVFAPAGETQWASAPLNRPITRGDRLWTDKGGRAEVHLGSAALHLNSETFLEVLALDAEVLQARLNEGSVNARMRQLQGGENFEIDTPNLVLRLVQAGDFRIDVDPARGVTRVTVRAGAAMAYGAGGGAMQVQAGQQLAFSGRNLEQVTAQAWVEDGFDGWAAARNQAEDQSVSARYVPREVVAYPQLDMNGTWAQDANYGAVWYPQVSIADWAPYRYGHWDWIVPWGWTWIDAAPWGFAPFHYGRWAQIGSRWAWVPAHIGRRPVYAPALVSFVGGDSGNAGSAPGSAPGIGWFPLAPGEAWRPAYRTTPAYMRDANRNVITRDPANMSYTHQGHADAITMVRKEDFSRGHPVHSHWDRVGPRPRVQPVAPTVMPQQPRRSVDLGHATQPPQPPQQPQPQPQPQPQRSMEPRPQSAPAQVLGRPQPAPAPPSAPAQRLIAAPAAAPAAPAAVPPGIPHQRPEERGVGREHGQHRGGLGQQPRDERAPQSEDRGRGRVHRIN